MITAVPTPAGVNTPDELIVPPDAAQVTAELYGPVPCTVAMQLDVCVVRMDAGEQTTATAVIVGVLPPPPLPPEPPPQPDASRAIETSNAKPIFLCNSILAGLSIQKSVCAKYSAKANTMMNAWQRTSARRPASESGSCAAPGIGGRLTLPSSPASTRSTFQTWSAALASRDCAHSAKSPLLSEQHSRNC